MKKFGIASVAFAALFTAHSVVFAESVSTVTVLDRTEPYDSMVAQANTIWVGRSRKNMNSDYSVEAYSSRSNQLLSTVRLTHSIMSMKVYSANKILVSGINPSRQLTEYSVLELRSGQIVSTITTVPLTAFATFWVGSVAGKNYFVDHGGNPDDDQLGVPAQTLFTYNGGSPRYLTTRLAMPTAGVVNGEKLLLISRAGVAQNASYISLVDTRTQAITRLNPSPLNGLLGIEQVPGQNLYLSAESGANRVIMFNGTSGELVREFQTKGFTRSATSVGHCIVAGSAETNIVEFYDLNSTEQLPALALEVNLPQNEFYGVRKVVVDATTGQTYARSAFPCNPMTGQCVDDYNRVVTWGAEDTAKVKALCL